MKGLTVNCMGKSEQDKAKNKEEAYRLVKEVHTSPQLSFPFPRASAKCEGCGARHGARRCLTLMSRQGIKYDMKSHVCWHVYGLLYRSDR
jgi:hypothetical protein